MGPVELKSRIVFPWETYGMIGLLPFQATECLPSLALGTYGEIFGNHYSPKGCE